jgi:hypothetical protein
MSQPLVESLSDMIENLEEQLHLIKSSGLDFGHDQEQLAFRLEGQIFELGESINEAIKLSELDDA